MTSEHSECGGSWLETDEQHDVIVSLSEVLHQLERVESGDLYCWKWAIVALASAANGALVCHLSGTARIGALRKQDAKDKIAALNDRAMDEVPDDPHLANPIELMKRACGAIKQWETAGPLLSMSEDQMQAFRRIVDFRNSFMHFEPAGWSIEVTGMPDIFAKVLSIVDQTVDAGWSFRHLEARERALLDDVRRDISRHLDEMRAAQ